MWISNILFKTANTKHFNAFGKVAKGLISGSVPRVGCFINKKILMTTCNNCWLENNCSYIIQLPSIIVCELIKTISFKFAIAIMFWYPEFAMAMNAVIIHYQKFKKNKMATQRYILKYFDNFLKILACIHCLIKFPQVGITYITKTLYINSVWFCQARIFATTVDVNNFFYWMILIVSCDNDMDTMTINRIDLLPKRIQIFSQKMSHFC